MRPLERVPAVRRIETDSNGVFAIEITGAFAASDAENLRGLFEGEFALHESIDLFVRITRLDEIDLTDLSYESETFLREHYADRVRRCALVGEANAIAGLLPTGGAEVQTFSNDEENEAWQWIGAREVPQDI